ncbi:C2 domain containing protein [Acanthamoeba castellanii str. Neff]|uniref:C2 domain containing protein n=1 Tax=Acanthamoeba castellanii (strain ATCC 30010 / Neff) TaxID=1257118 RepID=L8HDX8_ACACF|nr:C2 domain containing protein [Acanthamoeba castellanii str. Neff]ELR22968.1 C2 domain containing protein [Acanthamoeba castellanii str. Neff]
MSFVGLRQLQQREEDEHQLKQGSTGLKSERSATIGRVVDDEASSCPSADPYLDFLVTVTTARLANSGSASPSSPTTMPWSKSSSPSPAHMLSASMPASALQGPLYSVMRRQQLEVQQTRKRLDAEGHTPSSASSSSPSSTSHVFRTGNMQSTPQDLRSLASIVKRGILCAWSVQQGKDPKTGLPVPVSVFDPVRIIIDETNLYIAPQTATEAELPTRIALSSIHRVREFRTASKDWVNKYGLTLEFMTNTTSRSEKVTLVAPTKKSQQWWMKAVIMNKGLLRDWNEEFQEAMTAYRRENINQQANAMMGGLKGKGRHKDEHDYLSMSIDGISLASLPLSVRASLQVVDLVKEFTEIAEVIAQIIVDELHCPVAEKLIPPTQLGGMAGGEKYLSHGILFKFAIDSRGLYNGDEFAMKATQHEIKGLTAYINYSLNSNFPNTLHFPVMSVIDYKGFRLSATSILPVGPNTIVYGSADGSKTVHNKYKDMNALMKKAGRALNLKPHWVTPLLPGGPKVLICGPGDIEGHLGTDGRFYVLDTARVFPPTTPTPELKGSFLYRLMRPEFVKVNEYPLCSDAYSRWAHDPDNPNVLKQHNAEIVEATNHLVQTVIPAFAFFETIFIESLNAWRSFVEDMRVLVIDMHRGGINCRYLGVIRQHVTNTNLRKSMLIEMVSRVLKNELREHMRNVRSSSEEDNKGVIATFFGRFLQDPHFWQSSPSISTTFDVKQRLQERFPSCLTVGEQMPGWDLRAELHIGAVFARVNQLMGLNWSEEFDTRLWRWLDKPRGDLASIEELRCSIVKISPTVAQLPLVSFFAAKKFEKYADSPYASTKKQLESFLLKARDQYLLALEMKSDDVTILLNLASLFARLARCIEEQMHDPRTMAKMRKVEGFDMKHFRHRAHRFYQSADRQYQEALRIDSTRADLLAGYAAYLLTLPERAKEADKYYTLAMQANPHNDELKAKHERFHDDLHHRHHPAPPLDLAASSSTLPKSGALLGAKTLRLRRLQSNSLGSGILRLSGRREADDIVISSPQTMKRTLQIALVAGRSLHGRGGKESDVVDPYCVLQLGQQVQRSTTKRKTSSPSWNETFSFTITNAQEAVKLYVYDTGLFSLTQNCMGMRVLPISEIEAMNGHTGWYVLCASEGEPSDLALGEVRLHFQLE